MRFEDLLSFVTERMRMSHIYQPLLIRTRNDIAVKSWSR